MSHEHEHHHEQTSLEMAGGCAVGFTGTINGYNADAEARFSKALLETGKWVTKESGVLLGHIKAAIVKEDGSGITLNLTDLENGVEHHGTLSPQDKVKFSFMSAVLDVDEHELKHVMWHAIEDTGLDYELDEPVCHCHDHDHHHHDDECCHGHHHDDDGCGCHEHGHDHQHHHDDECHGHHHDDECHCHDHYHHHDDECCHGHHHERCCCDEDEDEEIIVDMTGSLSGVKSEDMVNIIESMDEIWEWIKERHGIPEYIEITVAPEKHDWATICMTEKDFTYISGRIHACDKIFLRVECAAFGIDEHQLKHRIFHAIEDIGPECSVNGETYCHCHDHKH